MVEHNEVISIKAETLPRGALDRVFPMVDAALGAARVDWSELASVIVCSGPGSFAGVRLGVAAGRGFALAAGLSCFGVESAEAVALAVAQEDGFKGDLAVCFGRAPRFAWRRYHLNDGRATALRDGFQAVEPERLDDAAPLALAGPAADDLSAAAGSRGARILSPRPEALLVSMTQLARSGRAVTPPAPIYLRPPDAVAAATSLPVRLGQR